MREIKYTYLLIFLLISACSGGATAMPTAIITTQGKAVSLPPTWTHTATSIPSQTPERTPTLTFTPLPSVTPLPATLTSPPTSDAPTLTATGTMTPTQDTSCKINASQEHVAILPAPYIDPYRVLPTLSPTTTYRAISSQVPYIEVALDESPLGWVDSRQQSLKVQGPGCELLPADTRELTAFPGLCFFTPDGEIMAYQDRALTEPHQTITSTIKNVLLLKYSDVLYTSTGEPESGIFVSADQVITSGTCETVPYAGLTTAETWLWSQPDDENGQQLEKIQPAQRIFIQEGPIGGPNPPSASTDGGWYFVMVGKSYEYRSGWIWSSYVFVE